MKKLLLLVFAAGLAGAQVSTVLPLALTLPPSPGTGGGSFAMVLTNSKWLEVDLGSCIQVNAPVPPSKNGTISFLNGAGCPWTTSTANFTANQVVTGLAAGATTFTLPCGGSACTAANSITNLQCTHQGLKLSPTQGAVIGDYGTSGNAGSVITLSALHAALATTDVYNCSYNWQ